MINKCPNCGVDIKSDDKFCVNCGKTIYNKIYTPIQPQEPMTEQSYTDTQAFSQIPSKKSNKKLIGILIAIIALIVILVVLIIFLGGGSLNNQFVGTWNISYGVNTSTPIGTTITFQANGDLKAGYMGYVMKIGTWDLEGGKLCINAVIFTQNNSGKQCLSYSFSNGGDTLILKDPSGSYNLLVLTK